MLFSYRLEIIKNKLIAGPPIRVVNKAINLSLIKYINSVGKDRFISLVKNSIKALNPEL